MFLGIAIAPETLGHREERRTAVLAALEKLKQDVSDKSDKDIDLFLDQPQLCAYIGPQVVLVE